MAADLVKWLRRNGWESYDGPLHQLMTRNDGKCCSLHTPHPLWPAAEKRAQHVVVPLDPKHERYLDVLGRALHTIGAWRVQKQAADALSVACPRNLDAALSVLRSGTLGRLLEAEDGF